MEEVPWNALDLGQTSIANTSVLRLGLPKTLSLPISEFCTCSRAQFNNTKDRAEAKIHEG